jgi:hypothetical protein
VRARNSSSNRLISDGDSVARNAFRVGLREDTPLPVASSPSAQARLGGTAAATRELDPNDILEVQDMAAAIARAEMLIASPVPPRTRPDLFETLGRRATDDTAGPATPAPPNAFPTPVPPRYVTIPAAVASPEDDAFYHPVGRMRSLADVTLDGYRPEPTLLVRAASRRKRLSLLMVAALLPLLVLACIAIFAATDEREVSASPSSTSPRAPTTAAPQRTPLTTSSAVGRVGGGAPVPVAAPVAPATPVFDVNSLPSARDRR